MPGRKPSAAEKSHAAMNKHLSVEDLFDEVFGSDHSAPVETTLAADPAAAVPPAAIAVATPPAIITGSIFWSRRPVLPLGPLLLALHLRRLLPQKTHVRALLQRPTLPQEHNLLSYRLHLNRSCKPPDLRSRRPFTCRLPAA